MMNQFFSRWIVSLLALPIALGIVIISPWMRIKFIRLFSYRIGHYALNTELMLCALDQQLDKNKNSKLFFYTMPGEVLCNAQLHKMWKRSITILPFPLLWSRVDRLLKINKTYSHDSFKETYENSEGGNDRLRLLEKISNCHIAFTREEEAEGKKALEKLGIPEGARFICLLVRDSQYLKTHLPNTDWSYHAYRDSDIQQYQAAAKFLAEQGYYVIRMGQHVNQTFAVDHPRVIDYANSPLRSDFMDIYLSAHCYFFISTSSGLDSIAHIFRKPILLTNFPLTDLRTWCYWTLLIPKKIWDVTSNRFLTLQEIFQGKELFNDKKKMVDYFQQKQWRFVDNTPEEIVAAVKEMLEKMTGRSQESAENKLLQARFWEKFPMELPEGTLSYLDIKVRIGKDFLQDNQFFFN